MKQHLLNFLRHLLRIERMDTFGLTQAGGYVLQCGGEVAMAYGPTADFGPELTILGDTLKALMPEAEGVTQLTGLQQRRYRAHPMWAIPLALTSLPKCIHFVIVVTFRLRWA